MVLKRITHGKNKGKWGVYHCSKKTRKSKLIKAFRSREKARRMHTAIIMSKLRRKQKYKNK